MNGTLRYVMRNASGAHGVYPCGADCGRPVDGSIQQVTLEVWDMDDGSTTLRHFHVACRTPEVKS